MTMPRLEPVDSGFATGWLAVDNDKAVIHRASLCPQAYSSTFINQKSLKRSQGVGQIKLSKWAKPD
jgi:hypothetical protein